MKTQTHTHTNRTIRIQGPNTPVSAQWFPGMVAAFGVLVLGNPPPLEGQTLPGHVPPITANLQPIGHLGATNCLRLAIDLRLRDPAGLDSFLEQIYDPTNPNFRHYLTPAQFTERFGPTEQDYQAVISFANATGLVVTQTHPNRMLVDMRGTVADIERAFHLNLLLYQHPTEARIFHAPDVGPSVPLALPLLDISGLDNYELPHPCHVLQPPGAGPSPCGWSGPGGYIGYDFRHAYAPDVPQTGTNESVGIVAFDGFYPIDILNYETTAGLPHLQPTVVPIDGGISNPGPNNDEVAMDIELAISMAPGLAHVIVYEAPIDSDACAHDLLNQMATDNAARALSTSWIWPDNTGWTHPILKQMAAQGQSFFTASGDERFTWHCNGFPAPTDDSYACVAGGTFLTMNGNGVSYASETVWTAGPDFGSVGGISTVYPIPSWQTGIDMSANHGSTTMRNIPDVAMVADYVYVTYNNGTNGIFGGTSCAAPLWAGFAALVNQYALANGSLPLGFPNPAIYAAGKNYFYPYYFHDVTTGNTYFSCSPIQFSAVPGYDLCTGWGSPRGMNLVHALAAVQCMAAPSGLVAWWRGEGNTADYTGYHNGVADGALYYAAGEVGQSFLFPSGQLADVHVPNGGLNAGAWGGFTVEAWVNPSDLTTARPIVEWMGSPYGVRFYTSVAAPSGNGPGCLYADLIDTSGVAHKIASADPKNFIVANRFQHVALTFDKSSGLTTLYLNGVPVAQQTFASVTPATTGDLYLGYGTMSGGYGGSRWAGQLDEVTLYNRALTDGEIYLIRQAGQHGKCAN